MAKTKSVSRSAAGAQPAPAKPATNGSARRGGQAPLHERRLASLAELGQLAMSGHDLASIMEKALAATAEGLEVQGCAIGEVLPNGKDLILRVTRGRADERAAASVYSVVDDTFAAFVLNAKAPVLVGDLREETRFRVRQSQLDSGIVSRVATVIQGLGQPYGLLGASSDEVDKFSAADAHFLQAIANILGDAVRHHRSGEESDLLMTLTQVISNAEDFNAALRATVEQVGRSGNWAYGEAWVPDGKANLLRCSKPWSVNVEALADFRQLSEGLTCPMDPMDYSLPARIWSSKKPEWIVDVSIVDKGLFARAPEASEAGLKAALGMPVCYGNEVVAILIFLSNHVRQEDRRHVELVSTVASQLASLLKRRLAEERLQKSNATNKALLSAIPDMLFRMARDGTCLEFVPDTKGALAVDPEELVGKKVLAVLPQPQASLFMRAIDRVIGAGGTEQLEYELDYGGTVHHYQARLSRCAPDEALLMVRDITEQHETELALRESDERYRHLFEKTPAMLHYIAEDGSLLAVSERWLEVLGYTEEEVLGRKSIEFLTEESRVDAVVNLARLRKEGTLRDVPYQFVKKNGEIIDVLLSALVQRDAEGKITHQVAVLNDITERKKAGETRWENDQRYRALFDHSLDAVYVHDLKGNFLDANDAALSLLGYSRDEISGLSFADLLDDSRLPAALTTLQEILKNGHQARPSTIKLNRKDGSLVIVESVSATITEGGRPVAILGIARDITERRRAEAALQRAHDELELRVDERTAELHDVNESLHHEIENREEAHNALRESEEWRKLAQDAGGIGTYDWDIEKNTAKCSAQYFRLFGLDPSLNVSLEEFMEHVHEDDAERVREEVNNTLEHGAPYAADYRVRWPDGSIHWISDRAKLVKNDEGRPVRFLGAITDFTERRRLEDELQQTREELEGKVEREMVRGNPYRLTFREFTVLHHVIDGDTDKGIAAKLGISPLTVHKHVSNLLAKMDASSRTEAGTRAVREGLLD